MQLCSYAAAFRTVLLCSDMELHVNSWCKSGLWW